MAEKVCDGFIPHIFFASLFDLSLSRFEKPDIQNRPAKADFVC